jgi:hypothetical protein
VHGAARLGPMPLFYFHVRGGHAPAEAQEALELEDDSAALQSAAAAARSLIASDVLEGVLDLSARIEVEDGDRNPVLTVPFATVVKRC